MKKQILFSLGIALLAFVSCGKQTQAPVQEEEVFKVKTEEKQAAPIAEKVGVRDYVDTIAGRVYQMTIERRPDDSLPVVTDVLGTMFYDNVVFLSVKCDSTEVYSHTFRKQQFMEYLTEEDREYGTLAGMTYYKEQSNGNKLVFGSQVCMPGMDGGALLKLELSIGNWDLKIMRDETADVEVDPLQFEEEGVWGKGVNLESS